jgi:phospholipid transport system substrate-binding protein
MKNALFGALSLVLTFACAPVLSTVARADADPAAAQIQSFYDTLLDTMKHGKALGINGRYEKLKPAVDQAYDLPLMTSLVVGSSWSTLSAGDQKDLIAAFERMTIANYASNFDDFSGEKFTVDPAVQTRGVDKVVMSKLIAGGQTIPFNYRMRQSGGTWKIVDVYLNGFVSQLATKRSDFGATLSAGGASALIKKLNEVSDQEMKK